MQVSYVSESAAMLLTPRQCAAMVSITEPGREAPLPWPEVWGALLRVQFADAEYDEQMLARMEARGKALRGLQPDGVCLAARPGSVRARSPTRKAAWFPAVSHRQERYRKSNF